MCETGDGFKIAEMDLELRGPGDAEGTRQSGMLDLKLADLSKDGPVVQLARTLIGSVQTGALPALSPTILAERVTRAADINRSTP